jgi:two-component sensor histidine kinase
LKERVVLLLEVHHRVKIPLQLVSSLLNLQVHQLTDPVARDALEECKSRIETIALIHEKLYQAHDYARVPFSEYVQLLAGHILQASGAASGRIELSLETEDILLAVDRAIPCALLLNELLTNSLKHAFPDGRRGRLRVLLQRLHGQLRLTVADDGIGMPPGFNPANSSSLGMQLVATLSEQLDGHLQIERSPGTTFRLDFSAEGQA